MAETFRPDATVAAIARRHRVKVSHLSVVDHLRGTVRVLKSSAHFRGAYQQMARAILLAISLGQMESDLSTLGSPRAGRPIAPHDPAPGHHRQRRQRR